MNRSTPMLAPEDTMLHLAPGLSCRLHGLPPVVYEPLSRYQQAASTAPSTSPLALAGTPPPRQWLSQTRRQLLAEDHLTVWCVEEGIVLEGRSLTAWCQPAAGKAGIEISPGDEDALALLTSRVLPALLFQLARPRGWTGLHAAAFIVDGRGVLLPSSSRVEKSSLASAAAGAGWPIVADDLVWLRLSRTDRKLHVCAASRPSIEASTRSTAEIEHIIFPTISTGSNYRTVLPTCETIGRLMGHGAVFSNGPLGARGFRTMSRVAASVTSHRLEVGPDRGGLQTIENAVKASRTPSSATASR